MPIINLDSLKDNEWTRNLTGYERGVAARNEFRLSELDDLDDIIEVHVPDTIDAISTSFFNGMFADSVKAAGADFLEKYQFHAPDLVMKQVMQSIHRIRTRENPDPDHDNSINQEIS